MFIESAGALVRPRTRLMRIALPALFVLAACNGSTSYLDATGAAGHPEAELGIRLLVTSCAVVAIVCAVVLAGIARRRPAGASGTTRREIAPGLKWLYVGISATVVVLILTFADTMVT